jgi:hypothetical protein
MENLHVSKTIAFRLHLVSFFKNKICSLLCSNVVVRIPVYSCRSFLSRLSALVVSVAVSKGASMAHQLATFTTPLTAEKGGIINRIYKERKKERQREREREAGRQASRQATM